MVTKPSPPVQAALDRAIVALLPTLAEMHSFLGGLQIDRFSLIVLLGLLPWQESRGDTHLALNAGKPYEVAGFANPFVSRPDTSGRAHPPRVYDVHAHALIGGFLNHANRQYPVRVLNWRRFDAPTGRAGPVTAGHGEVVGVWRRVGQTLERSAELVPMGRIETDTEQGHLELFRFSGTGSRDIVIPSLRSETQWVKIDGDTFSVQRDKASRFGRPHAQHHELSRKGELLEETLGPLPDGLREALRHFSNRGVLIHPAEGWEEQVAPPFGVVAHVLARAVTRTRVCYDWELDDVAHSLQQTGQLVRTEQPHFAAMSQEVPSLITTTGRINFDAPWWKGAVKEPEPDLDTDATLVDNEVTRAAIADYLKHLKED